MQTDNLELKKLVYLYLMNYAKSQPDLAIMAVNTFVKVTMSGLVLVSVSLRSYSVPFDDTGSKYLILSFTGL